MSHNAYLSLREFLRDLERRKLLQRIVLPIDPRLEMTEICHRSLRQEGPALLFENPVGSKTPALCNLFGTTKRIAMGIGRDSPEELRELGVLLASLKDPSWPTGLGDAMD